MKVQYPVADKYVVAVSGGVDSVVLLNLLVNNSKQETATNHQLPSRSHQLIVAHVDHGLRPDSADDARFVETLAQQYGLPFVSTCLKLSKKDEATARAARWDFLWRAMERHNAQAVITAHHRSDVLETMLINLQRGTGRSGLTSLKGSSTLMRPLLQCSKAEIVKYAVTQRLEFMQDESNLNQRYLRNRVRRRLFSADDTDKKKLHDVYLRMLSVNQAIDEILEELLRDNCIPSQKGINIPRGWFQSLPNSIQAEFLRFCVLKVDPGATLQKHQLHQGVAGITNALTGKITELGGRIELHHHRDTSELVQIGTHRMELLKYRDEEGS